MLLSTLWRHTWRHLVLVVLLLGSLGAAQPCEKDADCVTGTSRGAGRCVSENRCEAQPIKLTIYRTYLPAIGR